MPSNHNPVVWEYQSGHQTKLSTVQRALRELEWAGFQGLTARELGKIIHPGDESAVNGAGAALTRLRQDGYRRPGWVKTLRVVALEEKRDGHHVSVLPKFLAGRETWGGYRHRGHCDTCTCHLGEES